jgi:hypothetical protein
MVTILIPSSTVCEGNERNGGLTPSFRSSPLLETPDLLPQYIEVQGLIKNQDYSFGTSARDAHLSEVLHNALGMNDIHVDYVTNGNGNIPIIDMFNNECRYAIGPRCEILENQFGIGSLIMYLLDNAPLWIMTPVDVQRDLSYYLHMWVDRDGEHPEKELDLFPSWVEPINMDIPNGLPKRLDWILKSCRDCAITDMYPPDDHYGDVGRWPFATCAWYGFEPMVDRRMRRITMNNHDFMCAPDNRIAELESRPSDQGQASDPSWFIMDHMCANIMNFSHSSCMPECHEVDTAEMVINNFKPFLELLEYISHDSNT